MHLLIYFKAQNCYGHTYTIMDTPTQYDNILFLYFRDVLAPICTLPLHDTHPPLPLSLTQYTYILLLLPVSPGLGLEPCACFRRHVDFLYFLSMTYNRIMY